MWRKLTLKLPHHHPYIRGVGCGGKVPKDKCVVWCGCERMDIVTDKRPQRPQRERKSDRLIYPGATANQIKCDFALAPFDKVARDMEHRWGVDRLVELVPADTAAKYGSAMAKLNAAINAEDPDEIAARASVCVRGMQLMDQMATQSLGEPPTAQVWVVEADGYSFGLMRDGRAWQRAQEAYPDLELITERQMVLALSMYRSSLAKEMIDAARAAFPKTEITAIRTNQGIDDAIPF